MKKIGFILLLIPYFGFAQTQNKNDISDGIVTCLHYDTAEVNGPVTMKDNTSEEDILKNIKDEIKYRGNVEFKIGFTSIKCDEATSNDNKKSLIASNVKISCLYYPMLMGDRLTYNKETKLAVLTGHITEQDKGAVKSLGNAVNLDLSHERYIITTLR